MRIGFVVNEIKTEEPTYTTTRLAMAAVNRGHESWLIGAGDLAFDPDDNVRARARSVTKTKYKSLKTFLEELQGPRGRSERITVDDLDVLLLRNDPSLDQGRRAWAQMSGINFGRAAMRQGDKSTVTVKRGDRFQLRFGAFIYSTGTRDAPDLDKCYRQFSSAVEPPPR